MSKSLRDIRKDSGIPTNEIVYKMAIQSSTLYSWESGVRLIPIDKLTSLLKLYNYPIQDFDFDELVQTHKNKGRLTLNG